ncbi:MAG TPA: PadR family transcriptional regulator [Acidimicrobiales bacterium]|nr:PadR family transcriptional regulator [Acidimicrobiales bacterium]
MSNRPVTVEEHIKKLNPTAATLLGFLHRGPMTGWDLAQMAEMVIGDFWNVTRSQVYRELRTLEGLELVEPRAAGPREKRPYSITEAGRTAFAAFINREPGPDLLRSPLLLMVFFGCHLDIARKERFLAIHRLRHEQALDEYRRIQGSLDAGETGLADVLQYAILHEEAVLRWFEWMKARTGEENEHGRTRG